MRIKLDENLPLELIAELGALRSSGVGKRCAISRRTRRESLCIDV